jgi:hypothetical protein
MISMNLLLLLLALSHPAAAAPGCDDEGYRTRVVAERAQRDPVAATELFKELYLAEKLSLSAPLAAYFDESYLQAPEIAKAQAAARRREYDAFILVFKRYLKPGVLTDEQLRKVVERDVQYSVETLGGHFVRKLDWLKRDLSPADEALRRDVIDRLERQACRRIEAQPAL